MFTLRNAIALSVAYLFPVAVLAKTQTLGDIVGDVGNIINAIVPILIGIAVIYFIWGVIQYVVAKGAEDQKNAINTMVYGIIGLFVIVAVWGLVAVLAQTFNVGTGEGIEAPGIPTSQ